MTSSFVAGSWEGWTPGPSDLPAWGKDELDYSAVPPEAAGMELFEMLVRLKITSVLSARQRCILAFWASNAGAFGDIAKLALRPGEI